MGKVFDGIMGLVVGDALGVPFEFKQRDTFKCTDMVGYGTYNQPAGTWSDDSSMTLATLESIVKNQGRIDLQDIMQNFFNWFYHGHFTPHGNVFDIGNTTRNAINRYRSGAAAENCGGRNVTDNGNGSLMRILPIALMKAPTFDEIRKVSGLTHAHPISMKACEIYVDTAVGLIIDVDCDKEETVNISASFVNDKNFERIKDLKNLSRDDIRSTGYVVDTLEAAMWCFIHTNSYKECVLEAVNLGGDTDTIAAVAGGLAGIYYGVGGENGIPEEWIDQIVKKDWIKELCDKMEELNS